MAKEIINEFEKSVNEIKCVVSVDGASIVYKTRSEILAEKKTKYLGGDWDWDVVEDQLHMSKEIFQIFSIDKDNFKGFKEEFTKSVHPNDVKYVRKAIDDAVELVKPFNVDYRLLFDDGSVKVIQHEAKVIVDDKGKPVRMIGRVQDITDQAKRESQLKLLMAGIEQAYDSIIITDTDGTIQYVNPAFERITGFSRKNAIGENPNILNSGKQGNEFFKIMWNTILNGDVWTGELINRNKKGELFNEEVTIAPVKNQDNQVSNFIAIHRDITEKKKLEKKLETLRSEYESFMRHELKNLLAPIQMYADLIQMTEKEMSENQKKYVGNISEQCKRINYLVDNIKRLQDFEAGNYDFKKEFHELKQVALEAVESLLPLAKKHGVRFDFAAKNIKSDVKIDVNLFQGVFFNLIKNAVEHVAKLESIAEKTVTVKMYNKYKKVYVEINNKGIPIPEERLQLFFEKFNTDRTMKRDGTGLGTTYAYLVVKAHAGEIDVRSNDGEGTTVTVQMQLTKNKTNGNSANSPL